MKVTDEELRAEIMRKFGQPPPLDPNQKRKYVQADISGDETDTQRKPKKARHGQSSSQKNLPVSLLVSCICNLHTHLLQAPYKGKALPAGGSEVRSNHGKPKGPNPDRLLAHRKVMMAASDTQTLTPSQSVSQSKKKREIPKKSKRHVKTKEVKEEVDDDNDADSTSNADSSDSSSEGDSDNDSDSGSDCDSNKDGNGASEDEEEMEEEKVPKVLKRKEKEAVKREKGKKEKKEKKKEVAAKPRKGKKEEDEVRSKRQKRKGEKRPWQLQFYESNPLVHTFLTRVLHQVKEYIIYQNAFPNDDELGNASAEAFTGILNQYKIKKPNGLKKIKKCK